MITGIEFYMEDGEIKFIENGVTREFCELDVALAARLRDEIDNDPRVRKGLLLLGITDPVEQLKQYIFCRFGDFDQKADITPDGTLVPEYWNCGCRPCPADGLLCKLPTGANGNLTQHDAALIRELASDQSSKMIAAKFNRSKFTIDTEVRNLIRKLGCYTRAGICSFAGRHNLV